MSTFSNNTVEQKTEILYITAAPEFKWTKPWTYFSGDGIPPYTNGWVQIHIVVDSILVAKIFSKCTERVTCRMVLYDMYTVYYKERLVFAETGNIIVIWKVIWAFSLNLRMFLVVWAKWQLLILSICIRHCKRFCHVSNRHGDYGSKTQQNVLGERQYKTYKVAQSRTTPVERICSYAPLRSLAPTKECYTSKVCCGGRSLWAGNGQCSVIGPPVMRLSNVDR